MFTRDLNNLIAFRFSGSEREFLSTDSIENGKLNKLNYPNKLLNSLPGTTSLPDHMLCLKNRYMLMLLQSLQQKDGHVNGAQYIVAKMTNNIFKKNSNWNPKR